MATRFSVDDLRVGLALRYRGDDVPFASDFLRRKGAKLGHWMMPAFTPAPALPGGVKWEDIPGNKRDTFSIIRIETNRRGRAGKPLDDLVNIVGEGYVGGFTFGLNPIDVIAKFDFIGEAADLLPADKLHDEIVAAQAAEAAGHDWARNIQMTEGW